MADHGKKSRMNRFEKKRRNTKSISVLMIVGSALVVLLIAIGIFGGGEERKSASSEVVISNPESTDSAPPQQTETAGAEVEDESDEATEHEKEKEESEEKEEEKEEEQEETNADKELQESEPTDEHAVKSYTADWEPVGTTQEGPHTTDYSDGSQDRIEIKKAVVEVTGLDPDNMIEWRIANGGDQKVVATVSDRDQTEIYRVFLSWIDGEGWKPTKLEILDQVVY